MAATWCSRSSARAAWARCIAAPSLGLGREVAIKVVSAHLVTEPDVVKRFLREAKLASRLTHPNAVAVLDFDQTDDGLFYLVMELVAGRTLDKVFEEEHALRAERIVRIGMQVCDALEGAHALQIVHRDLKPSNIMILDRGRDLVKVLDFGLAKSVAPDQTTTTMTNAGALLGTPAFMPPELALGEPCDGRADLYSLGCRVVPARLRQAAVRLGLGARADRDARERDRAADDAACRTHSRT